MKRQHIQYCSRCGKRINGCCTPCNAALAADLARRQAIPPGCPVIRGEESMGNTGRYAAARAELAAKYPRLYAVDDHRECKELREAESVLQFDDVIRAYEEIDDD